MVLFCRQYCTWKLKNVQLKHEKPLNSSIDYVKILNLNLQPFELVQNLDGSK